MEKKNQNSNPELRSKIELPWLKNVNRAVQVLTSLSLRFSAQAALIIRDETLWAYSGQLPRTAAEELGKTIVQYWDDSKGADLMHFIQLETTSEEHKMYATQLAKDMVVALIFDTDTPFSMIRAQAAEMVRSLSEYKGNEAVEISTTTRSNKLNTDNLRNLLEENNSSSNQENKKSQELITPNDGENNGINKESNNYSSSGSGSGRRIRFEESTQSMYNLNYACLLIPRFPNHEMVGDLSSRLSEWIPQICIAYGWRLEYISVQADHLQWIVNVPPTTAPNSLMRIIRKQLSDKIFVDFPRIRNENPSGDFWAPGFFLTGSSNPHPYDLVSEFIEETRKRQGIS